jgi:ABC-type transporter Mla subunit MlaD
MSFSPTDLKTMNASTSDAISIVDTLATAQDDLGAAQSVIAEVRDDLGGPRGERLHTAVRALQGVLDDLEESHATAEELLDALR